MNNNFKTSLVITTSLASPARLRHYDALRTKMDMWLTPKLISECTTNSNFPSNHRDNENDQDNENHPDNNNEGNYPVNKYMFKLNNKKKVLMSLWLALNIFHILL